MTMTGIAPEGVAGPGTSTPADEVLRRLFAGGAGHPDPYPLYRALREAAPVHRSDLDGVWYVSRHEDCQQILLDPRCGRRPDGMPGHRPFFVERAQARRFKQRMRHTMLWANPPEHTRLRRVLSRAFTPRRVEELRGRITGWVDGHLDAMVDAVEVDAMDALAFRLPVTAIGELVGVPEADRERFRSVAGDPITGRAADLAGDQAADAALEAYMLGLVAEHRRAPRDDLLSALVATRDDGDRLSEAELLSTAHQLFRAGFITTTNLIGNGLLALLRHPAEMTRLWNDPDLADSAVEEMLRYDSPVQLVGRVAFEPVEVGGHVIGAGESIITLIGGANRDPGRFGDPERFDVGRADNQPLSFGWGIHHCLGAPLARLEAQILFRRMAQRLTSVEFLDDDPPRAPGASFRGLVSLPVRLRARALRQPSQVSSGGTP